MHINLMKNSLGISRITCEYGKMCEWFQEKKIRKAGAERERGQIHSCCGLTKHQLSTTWLFTHSSPSASEGKNWKQNRTHELR